MIPAAPGGTDGAVALAMLDKVRRDGPVALVCADERRAERVTALAQALDPDARVARLPAWDSLPGDRAPPSAGIMGQRLACLLRLAEEGAGGLVVTTPEALLQRTPEPAALAGAALEVRPGSLDLADFERGLVARGYWRDDRVDEPGEFARRGEVLDLFPSDRHGPVRIELGEAEILSIRAYDAATQRSTQDLDAVRILPANEAWRAGQEHPVSPLDPTGPLATLFDILAGFTLVLEPRSRERAEAFLALVADAWETRRSFGRARARHSDPAQLYLPEAEWRARLDGAAPRDLVESPAEPPPVFAAQDDPAAALAGFVAAEREKGRAIVLAAPDARLGQRLARMAGVPDAAKAASWRDVEVAAPGAALILALPATRSFRSPDGRSLVLTALDALGVAGPGGDGKAGAADAFLSDEAFRPGDVVVHRDHGLCVLEGLEMVDAGEAGATETIRLRFAGDEALMLPAAQAGALWRYGSAEADVALDSLHGQAWLRRRTEVEADLADMAGRLAELARKRLDAKTEALSPPAAELARFSARFPYPETDDQARAIADALRDLSSRRRTDRLVCGDVGFGKTEVALRAVAACVFAGRQAVLAAPTTVLVRQHMETFRRRFAGFGIEIRELSRFVSPAEVRSVKAGLRDGSVRIAIGTHALAGAGVGFRDLGLVVIDEEQRFGEKHKAALRALSPTAHVLALTATPIPRTLQASLAGLMDLSIIATPPVTRRPVRTALLETSPDIVREALLREKQRGGQSFVVCPRVDDIEPWRKRLEDLAPELSLLVANGRMKAADIDGAMIRFAEGEGDVLLATNIVESGLDVPNANTMLVWRPDRFGLSQLHQLRGRVGRGRVRGVCLLLTEPGRRIAAATRRRLETLAALDRPGAGFAISAHDLDQRGAGDLLGEDQSGHLRLVGTELAQHLLERALRRARGESLRKEWSPDVQLGVEALIPTAYIPEPEVRLNLYHRIARADSARAVGALAEEIEDRFGERPNELDRLLVLARLAVACRTLDVERLDGGPQALAATFRERTADRPEPSLTPPASRKEGRLVWPVATDGAGERLRAATEFLRALAKSGPEG